MAGVQENRKLHGKMNFDQSENRKIKKKATMNEGVLTCMLVLIRELKIRFIIRQ